MAQLFTVHPDNPQPRLIRHAADILRDGGLAAIPTDCAWSLVGHMGDARVLERIRRIRDVDVHHHFTMMCRDLSEIATLAKVDNAQFRLLKSATPGPYTFILEATRELPRRILHPKRKTIGLRVPDHPVVSALLEALGEPLLGSTLLLPGEDLPLTDAEDIRERLQHELDLVIDAGHCGTQPTSVIDLSSGTPELVRAGAGDVARFGLD
ncbi:MAG: L-threonylcarbamoyladenylate synthase [Methyloversatilis sp.]|uniref:L-threonylcarbamoyladenylate synthase n=1 Tax=Methyloversatilis TaxID=378210 RepID=UPI00036395DE|nr:MULTISPECIES: L-threonylcarbamoyladenylate synthase [Methyloversatilis]MCR6666727.1 L-threonylcarbamoyladenylate synthase [Methyloversatilis sp.]PZU53633.1 MAG: threonylcarbamoyl-AMP synthase [Thauera sp.]